MKSRSAFTIVELLIVIVVIAILATLTIVAYNGIQNGAKSSSLQSDLSQAAKLLETSKIKTPGETYPANLATAESTAGIKASGGNTYTYTAYNTSTGTNKGYCLQASINGLNYYTTAGGEVKSGVCETVVNLAANPSFESDLTGWSSYFSPSRTRVSEDYKYGNYSQKITTNSSSQANGTYYVVSKTFIASSTIYASIWVKGTSGVPLSFGFRSPTQLGVGFSANSFTTNGDWQRIEISYVIPSSPEAWYSPVLITNSPFPSIGTVLYVDGLVFTEDVYTSLYADGSSPNWSWTGTPNNSTSTGPAL